MLQLTLTSGRLARAVATLARSLGGWCAVRRRSTRAPFVCIIDHPEPKEFLTVSSKLVRTLAPRRPRRPMFVSIEPTRVTETQCIAVTHPSALYITDDRSGRTTYSSDTTIVPPKPGCLFSVDASGELGVAPRRIWARVTCAHIADWRNRDKQE